MNEVSCRWGKYFYELNVIVFFVNRHSWKRKVFELIIVN